MEAQEQTFTDALLMVTDNDRDTYETLTELARKHSGPAIHLADAIKAEVERRVETSTSTLPMGFANGGSLIVTQMVSWALAEVDWLAVANQYIEES